MTMMPKRVTGTIFWEQLQISKTIWIIKLSVYKQSWKQFSCIDWYLNIVKRHRYKIINRHSSKPHNKIE